MSIRAIIYFKLGGSTEVEVSDRIVRPRGRIPYTETTARQFQDLLATLTPITRRVVVLEIDGQKVSDEADRR
jgi:hypothetical protein